MFRLLSKKEEAEFRLWARTNYAVGAEISEVWHPVVQAECRRMCEENKVQSKVEIENATEEGLALKD